MMNYLYRPFLEQSFSAPAFLPRPTSRKVELLETSVVSAEMITEAARRVNTQQRELAVSKLRQELKILQGRTIRVLGLSFKPHTDDLFVATEWAAVSSPALE